MSEWKRYKLGELLSIKHGWAFKSENYVKDGKTALVTLRNISEDSSFVFDVNKTTYYGGEYPEEYNLNEGDLIIPLTEQVVGLLGNSAFVPNFGDIKFVLNQRVGKVQEKYEKIDKIFLKYLLSTTTVRTQMEYRASGTKQRNISPKDIYDIEVYIPELVIQKYIGRILYNLDKKIQINNQINQELEAMAKTLYDYWFVQFDFPDQNGKPYKSSGGKMVYNPELKREIPEGWGNSILGEFADLYQPKTISDKDMIEDGEYLVYGANGIIGRYSEYNHEDSMVTISCRGNCGIINVTRPYSWITGNSMVVKPKDDIYNIDYISNLLLSLSISSVITGSVQKQLTRTSLVPLKIIIPNKEIIEKYRAITNVSFEKRKTIQIEVEQLTQLRDWLLPMLMNGQVKVE